jgi:tetratricopeptide (TPR) repeat protein
LAQRLAPEPEVYYLVLDRGTGPAGETIIIRGTQRAAEGRWDEAEALWREVLAQNPDHPAALFNLGVALERRGGRDNLEQAQKNYARANLISNQPRYREALTRVMLRLAAPTGSPLP